MAKLIHHPASSVLRFSTYRMLLRQKIQLRWLTTGQMAGQLGRGFLPKLLRFPDSIG